MGEVGSEDSGEELTENLVLLATVEVGSPDFALIQANSDSTQVAQVALAIPRQID